MCRSPTEARSETVGHAEQQRAGGHITIATSKAKPIVPNARGSHLKEEGMTSKLRLLFFLVDLGGVDVA